MNKDRKRGEVIWSSRKFHKPPLRDCLYTIDLSKTYLLSGKQRVSSAELSEAVKVDSATIRRDFSYFGALGKKDMDIT